jgi:uncharacterized protein (UPF0335 family)
MLTNNLISQLAQRHETIQRDLASTRAELGDLRTEMKSHGVHKRAFAESIKLSNMGAKDREEYVTALLFYCDCLGITEFNHAD